MSGVCDQLSYLYTVLSSAKIFMMQWRDQAVVSLIANLLINEPIMLHHWFYLNLAVSVLLEVPLYQSFEWVCASDYSHFFRILVKINLALASLGF